MESLGRFISQHPFFASLESYYLGLLVGCASNVRFESGSYIFRAGGEANQFYLIRSGKVALEICTPQHKTLIVSTLGEEEILGWSWLLPPHQWKFDAHVVEGTRAIALDGMCLRRKCEQNHDLGYELLKRFSQVVDRRLEAARLQLMNLYGTRSMACL